MTLFFGLRLTFGAIFNAGATGDKSLEKGRRTTKVLKLLLYTDLKFKFNHSVNSCKLASTGSLASSPKHSNFQKVLKL